MKNAEAAKPPIHRFSEGTELSHKQKPNIEILLLLRKPPKQYRNTSGLQRSILALYVVVAKSPQEYAMTWQLEPKKV